MPKNKCKKFIFLTCRNSGHLIIPEPSLCYISTGSHPHSTVVTVQYTQCSTHSAVHTVQYTPYSTHHTVHTVQYTVQYTQYSTHSTVHTV